jgi:Ser/Thr protein kinase RdoA (MazF antagonist)
MAGDVLDGVAVLAGRCLPNGRGKPLVSAVGHDGTTQVFRAEKPSATVFVRLAEDAGGEMALEAAVHDELARRGVHVSEVLAVEPAGTLFDRGAVVLARMSGCPWLEAPPSAPESVARELGTDLGRMAHVPVDGFGFLEGEVAGFTAPLRTVEYALVKPTQEALSTGLGDGMGHVADLAGSCIAANAATLRDDSSVLAHGDLDASHVYTDGGRYAGIIDFGEVRGAPALYDVAHWAVHQAQVGIDIVPSIMAGYATEHSPPDDWEHRVRILGVLIGVLLLRLTVDRDLPVYRDVLAAGVKTLAGSPGQ